MSTLKNPFIRGYQDLTVQRQLIIGTGGGGPLLRRSLHLLHDHLNDERLFQSACRFCDHYALMLEGTPQSPTLNRRCQHEGTVLDVIHAVMVTESGELAHLGDAQSGEAAQMMVQRLSFDTGHYSQCWEISTAHLSPSPSSTCAMPAAEKRHRGCSSKCSGCKMTARSVASCTPRPGMIVHCAVSMALTVSSFIRST